jgi:hypothetical protein
VNKERNNTMDGQETEHEGCCPSSGQKEHDQMRKAEVDVGGNTVSTEKLMRPQTGDGLEI